MTPKHLASAAASLPSRVDDTPVAPYLTHFITHHGQVTLVPPQNQGRVRKNKRIHRVKVFQTEQRSGDGQLMSSDVASSSGSTTSQTKRRRKPKADMCWISSEDQGPSRARTCEPQRSVSRLLPPPSYDSLRSEGTISPGNHVISLPSSSSSDDFEDIAELDLESQWELDRMAGFTLEERVRREWCRRQASLDRITRSANVESSHASQLDGTSYHSADNHSVPSRPRAPALPDDFLGVSETNHSSTIFSASSEPAHLESPSPVSSGKPRSPRVPSENLLEAISSDSSAEDWYILESAQTRTLQPRSGFSAPTSGHRKPPPLRKVASESRTLIIAPSPIPKAHKIVPTFSAAAEKRDDSPGSNTEQFMHIPSSNVDSPAIDFSETISPRRTSRKGKEREVESICDNGAKFSAIHDRPLPALPGSLEAPHQARSAVTATSSSSVFQLAVNAIKAPGPHSLIHPSESVSRSKDTVSSIAVRERITRFESMHNRPVPAPPPHFLLRARVKRKPPPPPPASCSPGVPGPQADDSCINPSLNVAIGGESRDRLEASSPRTSSGHQNSDLLQPSDPETPAIPPLPSSPPLFSPREATPMGNTVVTSAALYEMDSQYPICAPVVLHDPNGTTKLSSDIRNRESEIPRLEPAKPAEFSPQEPGPSHAAPVDSPVAGILPAHFHSSTPSTAIPEGTETGLGPYTELDVLLSRLDDPSSGNRYEDLLVVSELLGPAQPQSTNSQVLRDIPLGRIEVMRRRKLQDGRIKLKLSLLGVVVDRCGVCLSQFKGDEWAALLPCFHAFHSTCLQKWLARSHTCPLCRVKLDINSL